MAEKRAAIRYAKAILSIAQNNDRTDKISNEMNQILATINSNANINDVLKSPIVKMSDKTSLVVSLFGHFGPEVKQLFTVLADNKRIGLLKDVAIKYNQLFDESCDRIHATVKTAVPMGSKLELKMREKLKTLSDSKISLTKIIDKSIIGGFILRVGDYQYDASVSHQLNKLKNKFQNK